MSKFQKASKKAMKLRMALVGPAGSGKTYTALAIATSLGKRVAVVDTERQSASLYADRFSFDVLELAQPDPEAYVEALHAASAEGYDVVIVDSLSHAWQQLLDRVDQLGAGKYKGNSFRAWGDETVTPVQRAFVDALLTYPGHLLATMRTKTAYEVVENERGKKEPRKIGLAPIQRDGVDYEFGLVIDMSDGGLATISKTRCAELEGKTFRRPGKDLAQVLLRWLGSGVGDPPAKDEAVQSSVSPEVVELRQQIRTQAKGLGVDRVNEVEGLVSRAGMDVVLLGKALAWVARLQRELAEQGEKPMKPADPAAVAPPKAAEQAKPGPVNPRPGCPAFSGGM